MHSDMIKIINVALHTPRGTRKGAFDYGLPVVLWSEPSTAKTSTVEQLCAASSTHLQVLSPGRHGEGAFGIIPVPFGTGQNVRIMYPAPAWVDEYEDSDGRGVVFLDEISNAPPSVQSPLLEVVNSKMIGNYRLPSGVRVIAAANPPECAANGYDMSPPLRNRFGHFNVLPPTAEEFGDFIINGGTGSHVKAGRSFAEYEAMMDSRFQDTWARVVGPVVSFLRTNSKVLHKMPKRGEANYDGAWPSTRTWELAMRAMAGSRVLYPGDDALEQELVAGFVGNGPATELIAFLKSQDLPDIIELLDGKVKWEHNPTRLDVTHAVIGSAVALLTPKSSSYRTARAEKLAEILLSSVIEKGAHDLAGPAVKFLVNHESGPFTGNLNNPIVIKLLGAMRGFVAELNGSINSL